MTYFFGMDALTGAHRGPRTNRQRERLSHTLYRLCEARNEAAMQEAGGGSADAQPAPRAPRTQRRAARKPATGNDDGDEPAARSMPPQRFYDLPTVAYVVSLSTGNIQKLVREGSFPAPRELSPRRVAWLAREVDEWCDARPVASMLPPTNAGQRTAMQA